MDAIICWMRRAKRSWNKDQDRYVQKRSWKRRSSSVVVSCCFEVFLMASVFKPSHKRKRALKEQAALMRRAKTAHADDSEDSDDSLELPRPSEGSDEESDFGFESDNDDDDAWSPNEGVYGAYKDWLFHLERDDKKMLAMLLYDNYVDKFKPLKTAAVASLLGMTERTVRQWRKDFVSNGGEFSEYRRGKYQRYVILADEEYKEMAVTQIKAKNAKGCPNMTAAYLKLDCITLKCPLISQLEQQHAAWIYTIIDKERGVH